jgi:hypothetical protein
VVLFHLFSLGSLNKDRLVDLLELANLSRKWARCVIYFAARQQLLAAPFANFSCLLHNSQQLCTCLLFCHIFSACLLRICQQLCTSFPASISSPEPLPHFCYCNLLTADRRDFTVMARDRHHNASRQLSSVLKEVIFLTPWFRTGKHATVY